MDRYVDETELTDNAVKKECPDEEARSHIQKVKSDLKERIVYHTEQFESLTLLAKQHEYAAQQYRILATAGDPVPGADTDNPFE